MAAVHTWTVPHPRRKKLSAWANSAMPPIPEKLLSGNACVIWDILASDCGRIAGPPRPPLETKPSTFISKSSVSGSMGGSDGNVLDDEMGSAPAGKAARGFLHHLRDYRNLLLVLADVRAHVLAIHVRAREIELERVSAFVLACLCQRLPVRQLFAAARPGHDRRDENARRERLLDARDARHPPVERLV